MHRIYARIPAHFYRVSLHTEEDDMTLALVPDQTHASLIAKLLSENFGLRPGENITVSPTLLRSAESQLNKQLQLSAM